MTIVIIPATSRTNTFVINALLSFPRPPSIRLVAHTNDSRMWLQEFHMNRPNVSTAVADLLDLRSLRHALKGARVVFYNGPVLANESQMGKNIVDAACAMDIEKLVYCSVLHPYISRLPHHRSKLEVEEYIFESGLNYTILQPAHLMQNIAVKDALERGSLRVPFSPLVTHGFLDLADFAAVAAAILRARPSMHARTRYELVGDMASYRDVVQRLSECAHMPITIERVDRDTAVQREVRFGRLRDAYGCDALARMISYYEEHGLTGSLNTLRWLLGRDPMSVKRYIAREADLVLSAARGAAIMPLHLSDVPGDIEGDQLGGSPNLPSNPLTPRSPTGEQPTSSSGTHAWQRSAKAPRGAFNVITPKFFPNGA